MDRAGMARGQLAQMSQVAGIVLFGKEAGAPVIPALDDVQWGTGDSKAGAAGHGWRVESSEPLNASVDLRLTNRGLSPVYRLSRRM
ncbi:MAG: hypothetical protein WBO23_05695, partial [Burkholderiales bacterium]